MNEEAQDEQDDLAFALRALKDTRELLNETSQLAALEIVRLKSQQDALLEALENLLKVTEGEGGTRCHAQDIARAAIAKAKGEDNE